MVTLNRIYTRTGDDGSTMLGDGSRTPKTDARVRAYGTVDELNSVLGLARSSGLDPKLEAMFLHIQNDLFDVGSDLCTPMSEEEKVGREQRKNRLPADSAKRLEDMIDELQKDLEPLKSFVLPGGTVSGSWLHLGRTVCRRAEIQTIELSQSQPTNPATLIYLNRLSDLLFVMARWANKDTGEVLWIPGGDRGKTGPESKS